MILKIKITIIACFLSMLSFSFVFSQSLEGDYPSPPGVKVVLNETSSLGSLIKFWIGWAIVIASVAVLMSVVYGGIIYLTSAGDMARATSARQKIIRSITGLFILFSSYLVLTIVNPSISIISPDTKLVNAGLFLFKDDKDTTDKFLSGGITFNELIQKQGAIYISQDYKDLTSILGKLKYNNETNVWNFEKFPLRGIGFWGDYGKRVKLVTYMDINFSYPSATKTGTHSYIFSSGEPKSQGISFIDFKKRNKYTEEDYFKGNIDSDRKEKRGELGPPLSIEILGNGPGVYLYTEKDAEGNSVPDRQKFLYSSVQDFGKEKQFGDFNDKLRFIAIKNTMDNGLDNPQLAQELGVHDYLAILHEGPNFTGQLKIFFEGTIERYKWVCDNRCKENLDSQDLTKDKQGASLVKMATALPMKMRIAQMFNTYNKLVNICLEKSCSEQDLQDYYKKKGVNKEEPFYSYFGKVDKPSSIHIFEISEDISVCKKVRICTERNFLGKCVEYTYDNNHVQGTNNIQEMWLPIYYPENIVDKVNFYDENGEEDIIKMEKNIRSIEIEGDCAVVLFENPILIDGKKAWPNIGKINYVEYMATPGTSPHQKWQKFIANWKKYFKDGPGKGDIEINKIEFDKGTPGQHSEVFVRSDEDLTNNQIGLCDWINGIGFKVASPCASAIAIYPIKSIK